MQYYCSIKVVNIVQCALVLKKINQHVNLCVWLLFTPLKFKFCYSLEKLDDFTYLLSLVFAAWQSMYLVLFIYLLPYLHNLFEDRNSNCARNDLLE